MDPQENPAVADIKARQAADRRVSLSPKECQTEAPWGESTYRAKVASGALHRYLDGARVRITAARNYLYPRARSRERRPGQEGSSAGGALPESRYPVCDLSAPCCPPASERRRRYGDHPGRKQPGARRCGQAVDRRWATKPRARYMAAHGFPGCAVSCDPVDVVLPASSALNEQRRRSNHTDHWSGYPPRLRRGGRLGRRQAQTAGARRHAPAPSRGFRKAVEG